MKVDIKQLLQKPKDFINKLSSRFSEKQKLIASRTFFVICLCVFVFSVYKIIDNYADYARSAEINDRMRDIYKAANADTEPDPTLEPTENTPEATNPPQPTESPEADTVDMEPEVPGEEDPVDYKTLPYEDVKLPRESFSELLKVNKDIVGWIKIGKTRVFYPVVQAKNNEYYLTRSIYHKRIKNGTIFADYRNNMVDLDQNTILYGHNMHDYSMFGDLLFYLEKWFFDKNRFVTFETLYEDMKWEVFSVYQTDTDFNYLITNFKTPQEYKNFLEIIQSKSVFETNVKLTSDDKILTLSTCKKDRRFKDGRLVVHAKLVKVSK